MDVLVVTLVAMIFMVIYSGLRSLYRTEGFRPAVIGVHVGVIAVLALLILLESDVDPAPAEVTFALTVLIVLILMPLPRSMWRRKKHANRP